MAFVTFPEPKDLAVSYENMIGDSKSIVTHKYTVENPHPGYGKDPNIMNEYGHTVYPKWVKTKDGIQAIAQNAAHEAELVGEKIKEAVGWGDKPKLREDGPTIHEYVDAGYKAKGYPPAGYEVKSTQQEIDLAIADEETAEAKAATGWGIPDGNK